MVLKDPQIIKYELKKIEIFTDNLNREKLINFENQNQELFSILKNDNLFQLLKKNLSKNKCFNEIPFNENLSFLKNYDLIINTDFSNIITKKYFNKRIVKKYECFAYTAIIKHHDITNDVAVQIFTKRGPLAFLPISNSETSVVYSIHDSKNKKKYKIEDLIKYYNFKYKIKNWYNSSKFWINKKNFFICSAIRHWEHTKHISFYKLFWCNYFIIFSAQEYILNKMKNILIII